MMARVFFPLIPTSTWMSPFDLAMALISCIDPNSSSGSSSLSLSVREWMAFFFIFYYLPSEVHCIGKNEAHVAYACPYLPLFFPDGAYGWKTDLSHPCHHCVPFPSLAPPFPFFLGNKNTEFARHSVSYFGLMLSGLVHFHRLLDRWTTSWIGSLA